MKYIILPTVHMFFGNMIVEMAPKHDRKCHNLTTWRVISEIYIPAFHKPMLSGPGHLVVLCLMELKMTYSMTFPDTKVRLTCTSPDPSSRLLVDKHHIF